MKSPVFGGDKRDRTADLLNAIQAMMLKFKHFEVKSNCFIIKIDKKENNLKKRDATATQWLKNLTLSEALENALFE